MTFPIAPVLERYGARFAVPLTGWHSIRCPFHDDSRASARVSLECNAFTCLCCGVKGDAIKIVELREHIGFEGACEYIKETFGPYSAEVPQPVHEARHHKRNRDGWKKVPRRPWD